MCFVIVSLHILNRHSKLLFVHRSNKPRSGVRIFYMSVFKEQMVHVDSSMGHCSRLIKTFVFHPECYKTLPPLACAHPVVATEAWTLISEGPDNINNPE